MALITQIKVGGATYDVAMKAGQGISISQTGAISINVGSGLEIDGSGRLCLTGVYTGLGTGLWENAGVLDVRVHSGLSLFDSGLGVNAGSGVMVAPSGQLILNIDSSKLKFKSDGQLTLA